MAEAEPERLVLHTVPGCGWCRRARTLLERHGVEYSEVSGSRDRPGRDALEAATGGRTFPQAVLEGRVIGGFRELRAHARAGAFGPPLAPARFDPRDLLTPRTAAVGALAVTLAAILISRVMG